MLSPTLQLAVSKQAEAVSTLHAIRELREMEPIPSPQLMVPVYHALALLHTVTKELDKVRLHTAAIATWLMYSNNTRPQSMVIELSKLAGIVARMRKINLKTVNRCWISNTCYTSSLI